LIAVEWSKAFASLRWPHHSFTSGQYKIAEVKSCLKANGVFGKMTPAIEDLKYDERA
jgi:hypothetical protein